MSTKKEVVKKEATEIALADLEAVAGEGFENQTSKDRVIPFLKVMQVGSKEVKAKGSTVRAGMLLNSATGEAVDGDDGVLIVPAVTEHCYVEYVPRDKGSGFVARHRETDEIIMRAKQTAARLNRPFGKLYTDYAEDGTPTGNELVETFYIYAVLCDEDGSSNGMAVLAFDSTDIKFYKKWNSGPASFMLPKSDGTGKFRPSLFSHLVRVTTEEHKYPGGESFNFTLRPANGTIKESLLSPKDARYLAGKELRDLVIGGFAKAEADSSDAGSTAGSGVNTANAPF